DLARELLGRVNGEGRSLGGLELELDSILRGTPGVAVVRREATGRPIPGAMLPVQEPEPGRDVVLTIDLELQEIADEALARAVAETG
ncbi:MAG: penicillin-binding protein, partial [Gemmatimonadetes bacterium]|nr:penicillin-binding protein [Gemmatimonadota bacterium]NIQ56792.1 penicillin-binding protein [Gemmatimonadota bacterium]NIU76974.1 penicillin-binding protein [Gammaproteobacteria bacterium]NIX46325.1 penicillin-binding protein [Gemmatimonadota bacterium]NIY10651.1 penicillin-binding protein [Gemmatimonadota bacterium]